MQDHFTEELERIQYMRDVLRGNVFTIRATAPGEQAGRYLTPSGRRTRSEDLAGLFPGCKVNAVLAALRRENPGWEFSKETM